MKSRFPAFAVAFAVVCTTLMLAIAAPPATSPAVDQGTMDAAMERLKAKQAAGRPLEDRIAALERKVAALESQSKRIAELESRLDAATRQIDGLTHSREGGGAAGVGQIPKEKVDQGGPKTWQCWVSLKQDVAGSGHAYRDYVQASSYTEASDMFHKKNSNENISQIEETRR